MRELRPNLCAERWLRAVALAYTLPWLLPELESERDLLGQDLWPYGVEANRAALEALVQYSFEQGLAERKLDIKRLFAASTVEDFKM